MFPLWYAEQRDYEQRHSGRGPSPRRSRSPQVHSGRRSVTPTPRSAGGSPDWSLEDTARSMTDVPRTRRSSDDATLSEAVSDGKQVLITVPLKSPNKVKTNTGSPRKQQKAGGQQIEINVEVHALDSDSKSPTHRKRKPRVSYSDNR